MKERRKMAEGMITAHIISLIIAFSVSLLYNLVMGLIVFALSLPPSAYISPKILEKLKD